MSTIIEEDLDLNQDAKALEPIGGKQEEEKPGSPLPELVKAVEPLLSEKEKTSMSKFMTRGGTFKRYEHKRMPDPTVTDPTSTREDLKTLVTEVSAELAQDSWYFSEETGKTYSITALLNRRRQFQGMVGTKANKVFETYVSSLPKVAKGLPTPPRLPKAGVPPLSSITDTISKSGVMVVSGKSVVKCPVLQEVPDFVPEFEAIRDGDFKLHPDWPPVANVFPDLSFFMSAKNKENRRFKHFMPNFRYEPFDKEVVSTMAVLRNAFKEDEMVSKAFDKVYSDCLAIVNNNFYGNGTVEGQMGRHKACMKVIDQINEWQNTKGVRQLKIPVNFDAYVKLMDLRYPLRKVDANLANEPTAVISAYETSEDPTKNPIFTAITPTADAGIVWGDLKRSQTALQDLSFADFMYEFCSHKGLDFSSPKKTSEFWDNFAWLKVTKMKPKSENYEAEEMYTKTRNIFVMNSCGQLVPQMILKPTRYKTKTFEDNDDVWSMLGWIPFRGGMNRLCNRIMEKKHKLRIVYADNVYVVVEIEGKTTFLSLDSSKAEASIPVELVQFETERSLLSFNRVEKFYLNYARHIHPNLAVNGIATLGETQIQTPYLGSGSQGTAYYNTVKMIMFLEHWSALSGEGRLNMKAFELAQKEIGCVIKIESKVPLEDFTTGVYLKLDVLGFDTVNLKPFFGLDVFVPVLSYTRMLKALLWFKSGRKSEKRFSDFSFAFLKLCRLRSLYMLGGWFYPGLDMTIQKMARKILNEYKFNDRIQLSFEEFMEDIGNIIEDFGEVPQDVGMVLAAITSRAEVPSVFDMIEFNVGTNSAMEYAVRMAKSKEFRGMLSNLVPLSVYKELLEVDPSLPRPEYAIIHDVEYNTPTGLTVRLSKVPFTEYLKKYGERSLILEESGVALKTQLASWAEEKPDIEDAGDKPVLGKPKPDEIQIGSGKLQKDAKVKSQHSSVPVTGQYSQNRPKSSDMVQYVIGQLKQFTPESEAWFVPLSTRDKALKYDEFKVAARLLADKIAVPITAVFEALKQIKIKFVNDPKEPNLKIFNKFKPFKE